MISEVALLGLGVNNVTGVDGVEGSRAGGVGGIEVSRASGIGRVGGVDRITETGVGLGIGVITDVAGVIALKNLTVDQQDRLLRYSVLRSSPHKLLETKDNTRGLFLTTWVELSNTTVVTPITTEGSSIASSSCAEDNVNYQWIVPSTTHCHLHTHTNIPLVHGHLSPLHHTHRNSTIIENESVLNNNSSGGTKNNHLLDYWPNLSENQVSTFLSGKKIKFIGDSHMR